MGNEETPSPVGIRRHLLFGAALLLAFGSMYAGVLGLGTAVQYVLAITGAVVAIIALSMKAATRRQYSVAVAGGPSIWKKCGGCTCATEKCGRSATVPRGRRCRRRHKP